LNKKLEQGLAKEILLSRSHEKPPKPYIRVSSISFCKRRIAYNLSEVEGTPESAHSAIILDLGNLLHDTLQAYLIKLGWIKAKPTLSEEGTIQWIQDGDDKSGCEIEVLDDNLRISGHCDGITVPLVKTVDEFGYPSFKPDPNGERYLIEIKTITDKPRFWVSAIPASGSAPEFIEIVPTKSRSGKFAQRISKFQGTGKFRTPYGMREYPIFKVETPEGEKSVALVMAGNSPGAFTMLIEPKREHILQASVYADWFKIKKVLFIYVGKDVDMMNYKDRQSLFNIPVKIFEHEVNQEDVALCKLKVKTIYEYLDRGELPPGDYEWGDTECLMCPYKQLCWPDKVDYRGVEAEREVLKAAKNERE